MQKIRGRVETQPRFKIQYPMKNHCKDAVYKAKRCTLTEENYLYVAVQKINPGNPGFIISNLTRLFLYIHYLFHQFDCSCYIW
jgi:hypothetical protein